MAQNLVSTSIGRKVLMALSGFFLMVFLLQHFSINLLSVIDADLFNEVSHFMGTNPLIQFVLQPLLIAGFMFHLFMGIYLDFKNNKARPIKYAMDKPSTNSNWMSRNMVISGLMIFLFLGLHFYDFWFPEIKTKFIEGDWSGLHNGELRYWEELNHKFHDLWRVIIYCISFIFLSLHLLHGFQSAFQSAGFNSNKHTPTIKLISNVYAIVIPLGFIFIALFHYFNQNPIIIN
jgi:succinate dehydrogenase / fumarate reductase cytochrome b subunit